MSDFLHRAFDVDRPRKDAARDVTHDDPWSGVPMPAPAAEEEPVGRMAPPDPTALLGWIDDAPRSAGTSPTSLTMRTPPPHVGKAPALADNADLKARVDAKASEKLLTSENIKTEETATKAMEILLEVPDAQRGKAIDALGDRAFKNLLEHVPHGSREKFETMIDGVKNPERKLKLWAEFHKSRARNDLGRLKGDVGTDDPVVEGEIADLTRDYSATSGDGEGEYDADADVEAAEKKLVAPTAGQARNAARHKRRKEAVVGTHDEVDRELTPLLAKAEAGKLTLEQVDALRERKDLEYRIERDNNLNLTANSLDANNQPVNWSKPELKQVEAALSQLPDAHVRGTDTLKTLNRMPNANLGDFTRGRHNGKDQIDIFSAANANLKGAHEHDPRAMVSPDLRRTHGDKVNSLELTLTHEIGHDVMKTHPEAYAKFVKAAGWATADAAELERDGLSPDDIKTLEDRRSSPHGAHDPVEGTAKTYAPNTDTGTYWSVDNTAIPAPLPNPEHPRARDQRPAESERDFYENDTWLYSKVNPREHFADVYAKAVHAPKRLHADLVELPAVAAQDAHKKVGDQETAIAEATAGNAPDAAKFTQMRTELAARKAAAAAADDAVRQRGDQFRVMRNDVFGTDKAVKLSTSRLHVKGASPDAIRQFQMRAEEASTPEQVEALENELSP